MHCQYCGNDLTNTSPRDSYRVRRDDSKFCDDTCRVKYHNAKRKLSRKLEMIQKLQNEILPLKRELAYDDDPTTLPDGIFKPGQKPTTIEDAAHKLIRQLGHWDSYEGVAAITGLVSSCEMFLSPRTWWYCEDCGKRIQKVLPSHNDCQCGKLGRWVKLDTRS